jgi:zinc-ribbon domain
MYCQYCGAQLAADARFCFACGKPTPVGAVPAGAAVLPAPSDPRQALSRKLQTLAILWGIYGGYRVLTALWIIVAGQTFLPILNNVMSQMPQHVDAYPFFRFLSGILAVTAFFSVAVGGLGLWAGWALWKRDPSGRIVALVAAVISLVSIPFGTALGIYTMVVLLPEGAAESYAQLGAPARI